MRVKHVIRDGKWKEPGVLNNSIYPSQLLFDVKYAKLKYSFSVYFLNKMRSRKNTIDFK